MVIRTKRGAVAARKEDKPASIKKEKKQINQKSENIDRETAEALFRMIFVVKAIDYKIIDFDWVAEQKSNIKFTSEIEKLLTHEIKKYCKIESEDKKREHFMKVYKEHLWSHS